MLKSQVCVFDEMRPVKGLSLAPSYNSPAGCAVSELFTRLLEQGYGNTFLWEAYWQTTLPEQYHDFGGKRVRFDVPGSAPSLKLAPPGKEVRPVALVCTTRLLCCCCVCIIHACCYGLLFRMSFSTKKDMLNILSEMPFRYL
jgi:hypothetical protein